MPTVGIVSGTKMRLSVGTVAVARATTCNFTIKNEHRETSHKDNVGDFKEREYGEFDADLSTDFLFEEVIGGFKDLSAMFIAKTQVAFIYGTGVSGDVKISGNAKILEMSIDATVKENVKASIKLATSGLITVGTFT